MSALDGMDIRQIQCGHERSAVLTNRGLFVMGEKMVDGNTVTTPTRVDLDNVVDVSLRSRFVKDFYFEIIISF